MTLCFDAARGYWYSPDLSAGNVAMLVEHGGEWPISGDAIAVAGEDGDASLLVLVAWDEEEAEEAGLPDVT